MTVKLTQRDVLMLKALSWSVRYMTTEQLCKTYWNDSIAGNSSAQKRINKLVNQNWLGRSRVMTRPLPNINQPLRVWKPGDPDPPFGQDAWLAQSRWKEPPTLTTIYFAGRKTSHAFLGTKPRGVRQRFQITHDLGLSEVFVFFNRFRPDEALNWLGEIRMPKSLTTRKKPDAVLGELGTWPPCRVIEFAGSYSKKRIMEFHNFCCNESLPYELW